MQSPPHYHWGEEVHKFFFCEGEGYGVLMLEKVVNHSVNTYEIQITDFVNKFIVCLDNEFHTSGYNGLPFIAINTKAKHEFRLAAMLLLLAPAPTSPS
jgi:hypothetical protein